MPLDELVDHRKIVSIGFIRHHPATSHNLQLPFEDQPVEKTKIKKAKSG